MSWGQLAERLAVHHEGPKDGPALICALFSGSTRHAEAVVSRTLIGLDIEPNKKTGEMPERPQIFHQQYWSEHYFIAPIHILFRM